MHRTSVRLCSVLEQGVKLLQIKRETARIYAENSDLPVGLLCVHHSWVWKFSWLFKVGKWLHCLLQVKHLCYYRSGNEFGSWEMSCACNCGNLVVLEVFLYASTSASQARSIGRTGFLETISEIQHLIFMNLERHWHVKLKNSQIFQISGLVSRIGDPSGMGLSRLRFCRALPSFVCNARQRTSLRAQGMQHFPVSGFEGQLVPPGPSERF